LVCGNTSGNAAQNPNAPSPIASTRARIPRRLQCRKLIRPGPGLNRAVRVASILQSHRGFVIGASAALPLLACWLLSLIRGTVANANAALVLVLLVVASAATGLRLAGIAGDSGGVRGLRLLPHRALQHLDHRRPGRHRDRGAPASR